VTIGPVNFFQMPNAGENYSFSFRGICLKLFDFEILSVHSYMNYGSEVWYWSVLGGKYHGKLSNEKAAQA